MGGIFEVYVKSHFSAAHSLRGYPGVCRKVHGHNWIIEVYVKCAQLNEIGIGIDFHDIKAALAEVLSGLDHSDLNDLPAFAEQNPTSENIARFIYGQLSGKINSSGTRVSRVKVCETPGAGAFYWEE